MLGSGDALKAELRDQGHAHVCELLAEGNTGDGFDVAFGVLGSVRLSPDRVVFGFRCVSVVSGFSRTGVVFGFSGVSVVPGFPLLSTGAGGRT